MTTNRVAHIYLRNDTGSKAALQIWHNTAARGTDSAVFFAGPGQRVGPLDAHFQTGIGTGGDQDYWIVRAAVPDTGKIYVSNGSVTSHWKQCMLQHADIDKDITFDVSTTHLGLNLPSGGCGNDMVFDEPYRKIQRVFVLMLENHSFDSVFANSGIPGIQAATAANSNYCHSTGQTYTAGPGLPARMPEDPHHEFPDALVQLCGRDAQYHSGNYPSINNSGFADSWSTLASGGDMPLIMKGFDTPSQLPVINELAREFAVCDQWFSSLPGPTWPNRFFVHGASSAGLDTSPTQGQIEGWVSGLGGGFKYEHGSIFDLMDAHGFGKQWRIYNDTNSVFSDNHGDRDTLGAIPQVASLHNISIMTSNNVTRLAGDLKNDVYPYKYTFIEPHYGRLGDNSYRGGSSQHPMDDTAGGEGLIKYVYESIRRSPYWYNSLFIVAYDEHGGFYDSVAPPAARPPGDRTMGSSLNHYGFKFDRYGARVPAVVISPFISRGTVDHTLYDHASVPATIQNMLNLPHLTDRDAYANDVLHLASLDTPRTDCPMTLNG